MISYDFICCLYDMIRYDMIDMIDGGEKNEKAASNTDRRREATGPKKLRFLSGRHYSGTFGQIGGK